jgi:hypothetical protein
MPALADRPKYAMDVGTKIDLVLSLNDERIRTKALVVTKYPQVGNGLIS